MNKFIVATTYAMGWVTGTVGVSRDWIVNGNPTPTRLVFATLYCVVMCFVGVTLWRDFMADVRRG